MDICEFIRLDIWPVRSPRMSMIRVIVLHP